VLVLQEIFVATNEMNRQSPPQTNSFELMREVAALSWLAGDPRNMEQPEQREWNDPIKPAYLKMTLVRRDGQRTITNSGIFWIPTGYSPSGLPPVDPVTRNTN
jgi:hypothetical protein